MKPREARYCDVPECGRKHFALGKCKSHYRRQRWAQGKDGAPSKRYVLRVEVTDRLTGEVTPMKAWAIRAVGWLVFCPRCCAMTGASSPTERYCLGCPTDLRLT